MQRKPRDRARSRISPASLKIWTAYTMMVAYEIKRFAGTASFTLLVLACDFALLPLFVHSYDRKREASDHGVVISIATA